MLKRLRAMLVAVVGVATLLAAAAPVLAAHRSTRVMIVVMDQMQPGYAKKYDMKTLPGVIAIYVKSGNQYALTSSSSTMSSAEKAWWQQNGQALVNTMCFAGSADVVGLLADKTSYGAFGDHGGAQKDVQRIPMAMYAPGIKHQVRDTWARLVDIMPTIVKAMGMRQMAPMDGRAIGLPL